MKYAFVTALTNDRYIPGLRALKRSLDLVNSRYPLVVLIPESESKLAETVSEDKALSGG